MSTRRINWYKYAAPANFYPLAGKMIPVFAAVTVLLFIIGLYVGFFVAPTDFQQGESYRIIFIHVPAAWMGMFLYVLMAVYAGLGWAFNARLGSMMATAISTTGAVLHSFRWSPDHCGANRHGESIGLGCSNDFHSDPDVSLYRIYLVASVDRRSASCRSCRRSAGPGRFDQCSDHLFLSSMVEHSASGRDVHGEEL